MSRQHLKKLRYSRSHLLIPHARHVVTANCKQLKTFFFNVHGSVYRKNILIYVQQDATLRSLFYLENALHVSGGTGLSVLWVAYATHSTLKPVPTLPR